MNEIDERFDDFWEERQRGSQELVAYRDRTALRWRFQALIEAGQALLLGVEDRGRLAGYIVLRRSDSTRHGFRRWLVVDLQTRRGEAALAAALIAEAIHVARQQGVGWIEFMGFGADKRRALRNLGPYAWRNPGWRFFYSARKSELGAQLGRPEEWEPSPFDGDEAL